MNIVLMLLLVVTQQSATTSGAGESFSQLVQLYQYAETQLNEVKTMFSTLMENVALQQKKLSSELRSETSTYIDEELKKLELSTTRNTETIKNRVPNCGDEVEDMIEVAITNFVNILDDSERMVNVVEDKLRNEPSSDDIDEINDEVDDILDDFKEKFEATIVPLVEDLLRKFKNKLATLQSDLRKCFDEINN